MQTIPANQLLAGLTLAEPVTIRAVGKLKELVAKTRRIYRVNITVRKRQ